MGKQMKIYVILKDGKPKDFKIVAIGSDLSFSFFTFFFRFSCQLLCKIGTDNERK